MPYALVKKNKPEAFSLGKGNRMQGWPEVFGRRYGDPLFWPNREPSNFEESFRLPAPSALIKAVRKNDKGYSGDAIEVADRIRSWAGNDDLFLINYWEEIESFQEENDRKGAEAEFTDLRSELVAQLFDYRLTGDVWDGKWNE